jgi:hypothetical protein
MANINIIPSVHVYQQPTDQDKEHLQHHSDESISSHGHTRSPSLISTVSENSDDHTGLLNSHTHSRNFSTSSQDHRESLLSSDHLSQPQPQPSNETETEKPTPIQPPQPIPTGLPVPATHPRRQSTRYYSENWGAQVGYQWEIQGGHKRGHNTGLKIWNSWRNAKTEWRVGNRARVLKYYVGGPALIVFVLLIVVVIVGLIVYFAKWKGA